MTEPIADLLAWATDGARKDQLLEAMNIVMGETPIHGILEVIKTRDARVDQDDDGLGTEENRFFTDLLEAPLPAAPTFRQKLGLE
jgi:hypothetical protein